MVRPSPCAGAAHDGHAESDRGAHPGHARRSSRSDDGRDGVPHPGIESPAARRPCPSSCVCVSRA
eukprot:5211922-Prymnesium_polylepis.1